MYELNIKQSINIHAKWVFIKRWQEPLYFVRCIVRTISVFSKITENQKCNSKYEEVIVMSSGTYSL